MAHICSVHDGACCCTGYGGHEFGCHRERAECTCWRKCTCELVDATTPQESARGEVTLVRGQANGCPTHETAAERAEREAAYGVAENLAMARGAAERRARSAP